MLSDQNKTHKTKEKLIFKFLRNLLTLQKQSETGNTLEMAMAIGLIALGGTTVALMSAGQNKTNAISEEMTAQAIAAAEAGVARMQNLFAQHPQLGLINSSDWTNITTATSNADAATAINTAVGTPSPVSGSGSCKTFESHASGGGTVTDILAGKAKTSLIAMGIPTTKGGVTGWQSVGDVKYKVLDSKVSGQTATVRIQGLEPKSNSLSQVTVTIPITVTSKNDPAVGDPVPGPAGVWAQGFPSLPNSANARITSDIIDASGCNPGATSWANAMTSNLSKTFKNTVTVKAMGFPSLPNNGVYAPPALTARSDKNSALTACPAGQTLPRNVDVPISGNASTGTYVYNFNLNCTVTLGRTGQETIKIYSDGAIDTANVSIFRHATDTNKETKVIVYGNNGLTMSGNNQKNLDKPQNYQLYIYKGNVTVTGKSETTGFIFAPNSAASYRGTSLHRGAIWAKTVDLKGGGKTGGIISNLTNANLEQMEIGLNPVVSYKSGNITTFTRTNADQ